MHGHQYDLPSVSSHAYSNTTQPNTTMEDPQGNTQAQPLSYVLAYWYIPLFLIGNRITDSSNMIK